MNDSTIYTVGTALRHAMDSGQKVTVLVEGHWLSGLVLLADSHGVLLDAGTEQSIIKLDSITVVRMRTPVSEPVPMHDELPTREPAFV